MKVIAHAFSSKGCEVRLIDISQTEITADSFRDVVNHVRCSESIEVLRADKNDLSTVNAFTAI